MQQPWIHRKSHPFGPIALTQALFLPDPRLGDPEGLEEARNEAALPEFANYARSTPQVDWKAEQAQSLP